MSAEFVLNKMPVPATPMFYALPQRYRQSSWRRAGFVWMILSLHLLALFLAFGALERPAVPELLPVLTVRVLELARPEIRPARTSEAPPKVGAPKPAPPARKAPLPVKPAAAAAAAPSMLAVAPPAPASPVEALAAAPAAAPVALAAAAPAAAAGAPSGAPAATHQAARFDADYLHNPRPAYPSASRRLGEEGRVTLRVRVSAEGLPLAVDIKQSSGYPRLDEAACAAVERWRFVPARHGAEPVEASVLVPLQFKLES